MTNVTHDLVLIFVRMENSDAPPPSVLRALYTAFDRIVWHEEADTRGAFPLPLNDGQRHLWWKLYLFPLVDYDRVLWLGSDVFVLHNIDDLLRW